MAGLWISECKDLFSQANGWKMVRTAPQPLSQMSNYQLCEFMGRLCIGSVSGYWWKTGFGCFERFGEAEISPTFFVHIGCRYLIQLTHVFGWKNFKMELYCQFDILFMCGNVNNFLMGHPPPPPFWQIHINQRAGHHGQYYTQEFHEKPGEGKDEAYSKYHTHTHTHVHARTHAHTHTHTCTHARTQARTHAHTHMWRTCTHTHARTKHMHTHAHIHTHVHTHTHTHTRMLAHAGTHIVMIGSL